MNNKGYKCKGKEVKSTLNRSHVEEENTITLQQIRDMFSEMFKKHEESIIQILTANNKLANQRIDKLTKKFSELEGN